MALDRYRHGIFAALVALLLTGCPGKPDPAVNTTDPRWMQQHSPRAEVAVVFVHGIFGDTVGTWANAGGASFFSLLEQDPAIGPRVDLYAFGFPSKMLRDGSFDIQEAANRLHLRMQYEKILEYPAIVFVAHSMGGLVVLRNLLTHREVLERVRVLVFYSTPQEGSQVTTIARHVANNLALEQMLPADRNGYLRMLNDEWKSLAVRPPLQCAYEKRETKGLMIVPWSSATRFCDGAPLAVDADHIGIAKPDRAGHDSFVLLANALNLYVLNQELVARLETPDFQLENGRAILTISDPFGKRDVRLVNAGGTRLSYTLREFPDRGLYVFPGPGPTQIPAKDRQILQFALSFGATDSEYHFVLQSDVTADLPVIVKVPDLPAINAVRGQAAGRVLQDLRTWLNDPNEFERLRRAPAGDPVARDRLADVVRESLAKQDGKLVESAQWVLAAELLNAVNWPDLAGRAVRRAVGAQPELARVGSVLRLAARTGGLAGGDPVLAGVPAEELSWEGWSFAGTPFTTAEAREHAVALATRLQRVPALKAHGASLMGDVKWAQGNREAAIAAYSASVSIKTSPLAVKKLAMVKEPHLPRGAVHR